MVILGKLSKIAYPMLSFWRQTCARPTIFFVRCWVTRGVPLFCALAIFLPSHEGHGDDAPWRARGFNNTRAGYQTAALTTCAAKPTGTLTVATIDNVPIVTLFANRHPVTLLLDTGAERTTFLPATAERIAARPPDIEFDREMHGIAGTLPTHEIELQSFAAGGVAIPWRRIMVAPVTLAKPFGVPLDGLVGSDVLSSFDTDIDLPRQRLIMYDKGSCVNGPPWIGSYSQFSTGLSQGQDLFFPVRLDGHEIAAIVDTGAQRTTLSLNVAHALGVTDAMLAKDRSVSTRSATAGHLQSRVHRFTQLQIGKEIIRDPELLVTDVNLRDADLVLGVDFLGSRELWLAYESLQIYLTNSSMTTGQ